jgi:serine/threonine protein kinase
VGDTLSPTGHTIARNAWRAETSCFSSNAMTLLVAGVELDQRYRLERPLATGGMSELWIARHLLLDRRVALKFVRIDGDEASKLLLSEARILASLRHAAIVDVYDCGLLDGRVPYLVMEYIEAETMRERLQRARQLAAADAVEAIIGLCRGVHAAHERGVIHRDIKPENIMCVGGPRSNAVKLIDFGIASCRLHSRGPVSLSGTPAYMAPEQIRGDAADARVDVWALGVTLYELLAGAPAFEGGEVAETLLLATRGVVAFPRAAIGLDGALWRVLMGALRVEPARRWQSAAAPGDELEQWLRSRGERATERAISARPATDTSERAAKSEPTLDELIRKKLSSS